MGISWFYEQTILGLMWELVAFKKTILRPDTGVSCF